MRCAFTEPGAQCRATGRFVVYPAFRRDPESRKLHHAWKGGVPIGYIAWFFAGHPPRTRRFCEGHAQRLYVQRNERLGWVMKEGKWLWRP